jgi:NAD(P)-dependent dehydrogenase (short-subunit alcohol dehydrogenase family)
MIILENKVGIVTGGASGMGEDICQTFAQEGCSVVVADLNLKGAQSVADRITTKGGKAIAVKCDITKQDQIDEMVKKTISEFGGRIDILINCAGGVPGTDGTGNTENIRIKDWDRVLEINLKGTFLAIMGVLPYMKKQKYGKIVNFSSMGAFNPYTPVLHYHAAKGGIESLTINLAFELAPQQIHVNTIVPGPILTPFWDELMPAGPERDAFTNTLAMKEAPLQRMGRPKDITGAALFLASDMSDYVTGQKIYVGGGMGNIISHESTFLMSRENKKINQ